MYINRDFPKISSKAKQIPSNDSTDLSFPNVYLDPVIITSLFAQHFSNRIHQNKIHSIIYRSTDFNYNPERKSNTSSPALANNRCFHPRPLIGIAANHLGLLPASGTNPPSRAKAYNFCRERKTQCAMTAVIDEPFSHSVSSFREEATLVQQCSRISPFATNKTKNKTTTPSVMRY